MPKVTGRRQNKRRTEIRRMRIQLEKTLDELFRADQKYSDYIRRGGCPFPLYDIEELKRKALDLEEKIAQKEGRPLRELGVFLTQLHSL